MLFVSSEWALEQVQQSGALEFNGCLQSFSMIRVYDKPFLPQIEGLYSFVDEIATIAKAAIPLLGKGVAPLRLIGPIVLHVNP